MQAPSIALSSVYMCIVGESICRIPANVNWMNKSSLWTDVRQTVPKKTRVRPVQSLRPSRKLCHGT
ncbi:hypothetical protein BDR04DRAFT_1086014 [Suillus decipiens]|nr:hypothetical protein BDR04DRAFT_1086014 [Suillus decipiens]